jgi:hypothetical protein
MITIELTDHDKSVLLDALPVAESSYARSRQQYEREHAEVINQLYKKINEQIKKQEQSKCTAIDAEL